jgi:hypothetical protein
MCNFFLSFESNSICVSLGCYLVWYCGKDCQLKDWDQHKASYYQSYISVLWIRNYYNFFGSGSGFDLFGSGSCFGLGLYMKNTFELQICRSFKQPKKAETGDRLTGHPVPKRFFYYVLGYCAVTRRPEPS